MSRHFRQKSIIAQELKYSCKALIAIEAVWKTGFRLHNAQLLILILGTKRTSVVFKVQSTENKPIPVWSCICMGPLVHCLYCLLSFPR